MKWKAHLSPDELAEFEMLDCQIGEIYRTLAQIEAQSRPLKRRRAAIRSRAQCRLRKSAKPPKIGGAS